MQTLAEARDAGSLGERPLVVLCSEMAVMPPDYRPVWMEQEADLAQLSTRGKQEVIGSATGDLLYEAPQAIIGGVRDTLGKLKHALPATMK